MPDPSSEHGVLAHGGKLWWLSLAYGMFCCDPFLDSPRLNFVALPDGCQRSYDTSVNQDLIDQRRCVRASEGTLRYVEIGGLSYHESAPALATPPTNPTVSMWTLIDPEGGDDPWRFEYEVQFSDIWAHESYIGSGLTPRVALVDPHNHFVLYFFQGSSLFSIHMRDKRVGTCEEYKSLDDDRHFPFRSSRSIVDAWELLPPPQQQPTPPSDQPAASPADDRQILPVQAEQKICPHYFISLIQQNFNRTCTSTWYCFTCSQSFCLECCPEHKALHHPVNEQARTVKVRVMKKVHCIREEDLKDIGYDLRGLQKFTFEDGKCIPIRRNILPATMPIYCDNCNDRMFLKSNYCGLFCRLQHVPGGNVRSREIVSALAHAHFHLQAKLDIFCTVCRRLFSNSCCANHISSHHPGEAEAGSVLRILRRNGMILIPISDLVGFDQADIEQIETVAVDGYNTVAVNPTQHYPGDEAGALCVECYKVIGEPFSYCCLTCMVYSVYY